jgi:predicted ribosome quality control (RQC) complex YloA/Tae2 family protein
LFWEFYASGNIVLVDKELNVLALLRNVNEGAEHERLRVGLTYNLAVRQNYGGVPPLTKERLKQGLQKVLDKQQDAENVHAKKPKKNVKDALRKSLAVSINEYPPMLVDHAMRVRGFDSTLRPDEVLVSDDLLDKLLGVLDEAQKVITDITALDTVTGYILAKGAPRQSEAVPEGEGSEAKPKYPGLKYDDFHPFKPKQYEDDESITFLEFEGFNKTVDEFYSSIEGQKLESRLHEREETARKKLEQTKQDHQKRIGGLKQVQELNVRKAEAIAANVERVEEVQSAVNGLIAQGLDWVDIAKMIEREQTHNNPVAKLIKLPLKLNENTVTMLLGEAEDDDEGSDSAYGSETESESESESEEDENPKGKVKKANPKPTQDKILAIDIDLGLSAWTNASQYYDEKKNAVVKEEKTLQSSSIALKSAERKIAADLKKGLNQEKEVLRPVRKAFWFEKFHYFISSDGYLVLGGKDAQQNEILYRRYLRKGDIYVHADINGASSVIIKNNPSTPDAPIPPSTLSQAGTLVVATSSAWDSKAMMAAWWVNADQVSKKAATGEFLTPGNFTISGKKNFLPPAQMLLGFAIMFNISEESKPRHQKHRIIAPQTSGLEASMMEASEEVSHLGGGHDSITDDSDEDFPDATLDAAKADSDDEDFPDAKLEALKDDSEAEEGPSAPVDSEPDSDDEDTAPIKNPLQTGLGASDSLVDEPEADAAVQNEAAQDTASVAGTDITDITSKTSSRHLSARERRLLRKGQDPSTIISSATRDNEASQDEGTDSAAPSIRSSAPGKGQPLPRGKRGKQKKAAAKYAYQDEEDRALAMKLLGSKAGQEAAAAEAAARKAKEMEAEAQKQRRREQHLKAQAVGLAEEEARRAALEGTNDDAEAEEGEDNIRLALLGLDAFIGRPLPGDELLSAIPVCAPWSALSTYKYKAKLQPGSMKKGKAVNEVIGKWQAAGLNAKIVDTKSEDIERIWPREVELVKGLKGVEVNGVVPVTKVRVMMAGGQGGKGGANSASGKGKGNGKAGGRGGRGSKKKK